MTLTPLYTEDLIYPSYLDRLLIKSLGVQAGVVGEEDYKVSAGTGLQVNVKAGRAFVAETKAIEESSNEFYNGLYHVPNPTETNPYNNVEVSSVNPQIAQIILRVYDVGELKIGGSSYARVEWLNGTPNAGATKAHVEEGKASEYGAAMLPQSSNRLAYVIVPKNATLSSEYNIVDERIRSFSFTSWGLIESTGGIKAGSRNYTIKNTGTGTYQIKWKQIKGSENIAITANCELLTGGGVPLLALTSTASTGEHSTIIFYNPSTFAATTPSSQFSFTALSSN